jgi:omega-6 fatty acid desaturase (delta-12 desaturase)
VNQENPTLDGPPADIVVQPDPFPGGPPEPLPAPSKAEVRAVIPDHCFQPHLATSLAYTALSVLATAVPVVLAWQFLPLQWVWLPVWLVYAAVTGTAALGAWVIAHECGHGAFSRHRWINDTVGFVLHSVLLVPYFSWQRSHAVHHAKTNHLTEGETHVPRLRDSDRVEASLRTRDRLGSTTHTTAVLANHLLFGWPAYLLTGVSGGPRRGLTNHFWPFAPFSRMLFPARWATRVLASAAGVGLVVASLVAWGIAAGSIAPVLAFFVGPYLVCNAWLVTYTWLHHTSPETPHYDDDAWTYVRGAFCSIDRPYGRVLDLFHHHIGSTHAAHHLFSRIPHYRAVEATEAIRAAYPELYRYDPTPIPVALWRAARRCVAVTPSGDGWVYIDH